VASSLDRIVVRASRLHRAAETAAPQRRTLPEDGSMFRLAVLFLAVALVGALLGFGVVADLSFAAARIVFFRFSILHFPSHQAAGLGCDTHRANATLWGH